MSTNTNVQLIPGDLVLSGDIKTDEVTPTFSVDRQNSRVGIGIDASSISNPYAMYVAGEMYATRLHGDGSQLSGLTDSAWGQAGGDISYVDGDVSIGIADANGKRLRVHESGNDVLVADGANLRVGVATGTPQANLHVEGNVYVSSNLEVSNVNFTGNLYQNGTLFEGGGGGVWTETGNDIYYTTGNVGVGTTNPGANLHVDGNAYVSSNLEVGQANLFVDTQMSRVGIGTTTPEAELHVLGNTFASPIIPSGNPLWYKTINSPISGVYVQDVATDTNGNIFACGYYQSTSAFSIGNGFSLPTSTGQAAFIIKYDSSGTVQWFNVVDGASFDFGQSVATDQNGNVYLAGEYKSGSAVSLGNGLELPISTGTGYRDAFLIQYNSTGTPQWFKTINGTRSDYGRSIATDSSYNVYLTGYYYSTSTVSLGNGLSLPISSGTDAYIVKYDSNGNALWFKTLVGTSSDYGMSVATDPSGNVYLGGFYSSTSTVSLGNGLSLPSTTGNDAYIVKYDSNGNALQYNTLVGTSSDYGENLATDSDGNVYFCGEYFTSTSPVSLGNGLELPISTGTGYRDAFIVKYDSSGNALWYKTLVPSNDIFALGVATDSDGSVYVAGRYNSTSAISLSNDLSLPISSGTDAYIVKYDSNGNALQYNTLVGTGNDYGQSVATDPNGNVYFCGHYNSTSTVSLGNGLSLPISTGQDGFIIKYNFPTLPVGLFLNGSMGRIGINTTSPGYNLDVIGSINFTDSLFQNGTLFEGGVWTETGSNIYYTTGNVGVGTTNPGANLHVEGNAYVSSNLEVSNVNFTGNLYQNGTLFESSPWTTTGDDIYYTTGNIGVGTTNPGANLHVEGNVYVSSNLEVSNVNFTGNLYQNGTLFEGGGVWTETGDDIYYTTGNIGVGTTNPGANLHVEGNVYISGTTISTDSFLLSDASVEWATRIAGSRIDEGQDIAVDSSGNVYAIGYYQISTLTLYNKDSTAFSTTLTNSGSDDVFIAKYFENGNVDWATKISGMGIERGRGINVDSSGNVYVTGNYASSPLTFYNADGTAFGTTLSNSGSDVFIAKYFENGDVDWVARASGTNNDFGRDISVDSNGNVYITGDYSSTELTFYDADGNAFSPTLLRTGFQSGVFIAKYNTSGDVDWVAKAAGNDNDYGYGTSVDSGGNVYVCGSYYSSSLTLYNKDGLAFSPTLPNSTSSSTSTDAFIAKYLANGTVDWAARMVGTTYSYEDGNDIAVDSSGNVYVCGSYSGGTLTLYNEDGTAFGTTLTNSGYYDAFVAKYLANGDVAWVAGVGGLNNDFGHGISVDSSGDVYIIGNYSSTTLTLYNADGTAFSTTLSNSSSTFIAKYNTNGEVQWVTSCGGSGRRVFVNNGENVYVVGDYTSTLTLYNTDGTAFGTTLSNSGYDDVFIAKYNIPKIPFTSLDSSNSLVINTNVGIGTTQPQANLHVEGNTYVSGDLEIAGNLGSSLVNLIYPIGAIYISVNSTDPGTIWSGTTWVAFGAGKTLVGLDSGDTDFDQVEETGGAKTHTLTVNEMPAHNHSYQDRVRNIAAAAQSGTNRYEPSGVSNIEFNRTTGNKGGTQAHNNLQPYIVTYMWKRTA